MTKVRLEILRLFANPLQGNHFTLLLGEVNGYRQLPMTVGVIEGQSIAMALEGSISAKPILHDLCKEMLVKLNYSVVETIITSLQDQIFFGQLVIFDGSQQRVFEARPSDAIAMSLRFEAPLFINEALLSNVGRILIPIPKMMDINTPFSIPSKDVWTNNLEAYSLATLQTLLARAVEQENYEQAILIREELKRRST